MVDGTDLAALVDFPFTTTTEDATYDFAVCSSEIVCPAGLPDGGCGACSQGNDTAECLGSTANQQSYRLSNGDFVFKMSGGSDGREASVTFTCTDADADAVSGVAGNFTWTVSTSGMETNFTGEGACGISADARRTRTRSLVAGAAGAQYFASENDARDSVKVANETMNSETAWHYDEETQMATLVVGGDVIAEKANVTSKAAFDNLVLSARIISAKAQIFVVEPTPSPSPSASPSSSPSGSPKPTDKKKKMSAGILAAIIGGSIVGVLLIGFVIMRMRKDPSGASPLGEDYHAISDRPQHGGQQA